MYDDIILFTKIVKFSGYSATAKHTGMLQPLLSRRVRRLEDELGTILIKRDIKTFALTEIGQRLYDQFKDDEIVIQANLDQIIQTTSTVSGRLNISLPMNFSFAIVTPYLQDFLKLYPNISLNITYQSDSVNLSKENIDLAITLGKPNITNQVAKLLVKSKMILYASAKYLIDHKLPTSLEELKKHSIIGIDHGEGPLIDNMNGTAYNLKTNELLPYQLPISTQISTNNMVHNYIIVQSGKFLGIGFELFLKPLFENDDSIPVLPDYRFGELREFYAILPKESIKPAAKVFLNFIRSNIIKRTNRHYTAMNIF